MCDTFVAVGSAVRGGGVLLAKNSDRDPGEPQVLQIVPAAEHPAGDVVRCGDVVVPQVRRTLRVLLSRPVWMFGAEMGVNEAGVAIGNEALYTRAPVPRSGLLGMDLLRLALERARTAREAVDTLIELSERFGQGGNASRFRTFRYFSGFLVADAQGAWVVEFSDARTWAVEPVTHGVRSISNRLSIGLNPGTVYSTNAVSSDDPRPFSERFRDHFYSRFARGRERAARTCALASARVLDIERAMAILRDHGEETADWTPASATPKCVCMHATGPLSPSQTTASMVVHLRVDGPEIWATASSAPCLSVFKPIDLGDDTPLPFASAGMQADDSYWWRHDRLHRAVLADWSRAEAVRARYRALEQVWLKAPERYESGPRRTAWIRAAHRDADQALRELAASTVLKLPQGNWLYRRTWRRWNRIGHLH